MVCRILKCIYFILLIQQLKGINQAVLPSIFFQKKNQFIRAIRSRIRRHHVMSRALFFDGIQQRYKYGRASQCALSLLRCLSGRTSGRTRMRNSGCYKKVRFYKVLQKKFVKLHRYSNQVRNETVCFEMVDSNSCSRFGTWLVPVRA